MAIVTRRLAVWQSPRGIIFIIFTQLLDQRPPSKANVSLEKSPSTLVTPMPDEVSTKSRIIPQSDRSHQ